VKTFETEKVLLFYFVNLEKSGVKLRKSIWWASMEILQTVKEYNGNVLEKYDYHYKN
jgi:hypothetical protein